MVCDFRLKFWGREKWGDLGGEGCIILKQTTKKWLSGIEEVTYKKIARYTKATAETDVTVYLRQPILMVIRAKV